MEWIKSLPKIELHAHLNGSIRDSTLLELAKDLGEKGDIVFADVEDVIRKNDRSLVEVFKLFDLIHKLTTDHKTVTRITREVVEDFALENVVYLELRTTPKRNDSIGMSKRSYMEAVIEGLRSISQVDLDFVTASHSQKLNNACDGIRKKKTYVRLLLSIDRRETTESAMETVKLALEMRDVGVVGIDLSGNPLVGEWSTFLPALQFAKDNDLHITLHCGEVPNPKEIQAMLDFKPHRLGHACFFKDVDWTKLKAFRIPVEICLTSNIITKSISSIDIHHFADLYKAKHPLILCTDDFGVFSTSLCNEYALAIRSFGLSKRETFALARTAIDATFAEDEVKQQLSFIFDSASLEYVFFYHVTIYVDNEKAEKIFRRLCRAMLEEEHHNQHFSPELFDVDKLKREEREKEKRVQKKREKEEKRAEKKEVQKEKMEALKKAGAPRKPKQVHNHTPKPKVPGR